VRHTRTYEILFGELSLETNTQILRNSLAVSADIAKAWFQGRAPLKPRSDFVAKGKLGDEGCGCVYVYYSVENGNTKESALYVGQTGGGIKARPHFQTSPHNKNLGGKAGHICVSSISNSRSTTKYSNFYLSLR
jgi:hypothetical protein